METVSSVLAIIAIIISGVAINQSTIVSPTGPSTTISPEIEARLKALEGLGGDDLALLKGALKEGMVTMYSAMPAWITEGIAAEWKNFYPDIKLEFFRGGSGAVHAKLEAEVTAGKILCDLLFAGDPAAFVNWKTRGVLERYTPPECDYFLYDFKDPGGYWVVPRIITPCIWYNVKQVKDPPKSWWDLTDPKWKGRIVISDPGYSGTTMVIVGALVNNTRFGWDYYKAIRKNDPLIVPDVTDVPRVVSTGERAVGVSCVDYTADFPLYPTGTCSIVVPSEGTPQSPAILSIVAKRPHTYAGKLLYRFIASAHIASFMGRYVYSARVDAPPPPGRPPASAVNWLPLDNDWLAASKDAILKQWREIMG